jgi:hypothetical protein
VTGHDERSRRALLAWGVGAAATTLGGCLGGLRSDGSADDDGTSDEETTDDDAGAVGAVRLTHVDPASVDAPVVVYSEAYRRWLPRAADTRDVLRVHGKSAGYAPTPVLTSLPAVELLTPDHEGTTFEVRGEGGTRYELLVGARAVPDGEVPADADPTPLDSLTDARRQLVERAIDDAADARVYPESPVGEWVREDLFGGYVVDDGTVYEGYEVQQTDAAFFSKSYWLVFSLSPTDANDADPVRLSFADVPPVARGPFDGLLSEAKGWTSETTPVGTPEPVLAFAEEHDYLLTDTALLSMETV